MGVEYKINIIIDTQINYHVKAVLKKIAQKTLEIEDAGNGVSLNILLTGNKRIKELNKQFLHRNEPTDVISFGTKKRGFIGEIAISVEMAEENARRFKTSKENEIFLYIIHGILHLLGYEDKTRTKRRIMENRQKKILEALCGNL